MSSVGVRTAAIAAGVVLLTTLAGCASSGSGFAAGSDSTVSHSSAAPASIVTWYRQTGPKISTLEQSITYAQWMVRRPSHRGLPAACTRIEKNVAIVRAAPSAPDSVARTAIAQEIKSFELAAEQCLRGELTAAGKSVDAGHRHAEVAGRRIVALLHAAS